MPTPVHCLTVSPGVSWEEWVDAAADRAAKAEAERLEAEQVAAQQEQKRLEQEKLTRDEEVAKKRIQGMFWVSLLLMLAHKCGACCNSCFVLALGPRHL